MEEKSYAESVKAGLEDAVAFVKGDTSRGRVVVREAQAAADRGRSPVQKLDVK